MIVGTMNNIEAAAEVRLDIAEIEIYINDTDAEIRKYVKKKFKILSPLRE